MTQPARPTQPAAPFPLTPLDDARYGFDRDSSTKKIFWKRFLTPPAARVPTTDFEMPRIGASIKSGKRRILYIGNLAKIGATYRLAGSLLRICRHNALGVMAFAWSLASFRAPVGAGCAACRLAARGAIENRGCPRQKLPSRAEKCQSQQAGSLVTSPELVELSAHQRHAHDRVRPVIGLRSRMRRVILSPAVAKWNRRGLYVGWAPPTGARLGGRCPPYEKRAAAA